MLHSFGSGTLWGVRTDVANSTPVKFGALQEVQLEFSANSKQLYGGSQFPIAVARGTGKITGKAKMGSISGGVFADLFFGISRTAAQVMAAADEAGTVPAGAAYTVTVSNSATFSEDLGVRNASTGRPLTKVAAAPATGEYSVSAGVYTFAAADANLAVLISYTYTVASGGQKMVLTNQSLGIQPVFSAFLATNYTAPDGVKKGFIKLHACVASKLSFPTKLEDFTIPEFDFEAFADSSGTIATFAFNEPG